MRIQLVSCFSVVLLLALQQVAIAKVYRARWVVAEGFVNPDCKLNRKTVLGEFALSMQCQWQKTWQVNRTYNPLVSDHEKLNTRSAVSALFYDTIGC